jgi:hypothetical protein
MLELSETFLILLIVNIVLKSKKYKKIISIGTWSYSSIRKDFLDENLIKIE